MLVELGLVEQRYKAVLEVIENAASVIDVARRYGVSRQTVHKSLVRYGSQGLAGLVDKSFKPDTCPHQMPPKVEAKVLEMRRTHPEWLHTRSTPGPQSLERPGLRRFFLR